MCRVYLQDNGRKSLMGRIGGFHCWISNNDSALSDNLRKIVTADRFYANTRIEINSKRIQRILGDKTCYCNCTSSTVVDSRAQCPQSSPIRRNHAL